MKIINSTSVVVYSSSELEESLSLDNGYTNIFFGSDITLTKGIIINKNKTTVTIDGLYENVTHNFTDYNSLSVSDTIRVNSNTPSKVIVKNMHITGNNYYGIIYVPESNTYNNTHIVYDNITYNGPQISYNPSGITEFIDATITIGDTSLTTGGEVAECNKIILGGKTTITHNSKSNSAFWFRNSNTSITVSEDSIVKFYSTYRELIYGVTNLSLSILAKAKFYITTYNGLSYGTNGTGTTTIHKNGLLDITKTTYNGSYATWYSYGEIRVLENATLRVINNYANSTSSCYCINFPNSSGRLVFENPQEIVFYSNMANIFNIASSINFSFTFNRINLFTKSIRLDSEISLTNLPDYAWYKNDSSIITGTISNSTTTITSNNYTEEELASLPSLSNFVIANKKILSIGDFVFHVDNIDDEDTSLSGVTLPLASILISYLSVNVVITSDELGEFTYQYDTPLSIGSIIHFEVKENDNVIYHTKEVEIIYSGDLTLENVPTTISFALDPISLNPLLCKRKDDFAIVVMDSRTKGESWHLYAYIKNDLTSGDNTLEGSLVFKSSEGVITTLSENKTLIASSEKTDDKRLVTNITWAEDEGILFCVSTPLTNFTTYETKIYWLLE